MGDCVRLLLIEDDFPTAKLLQHQLAPHRCVLHHAPTFREGLDYVRDHAPEIDVVVSDLRLPDSPANDTVKQLGRLTADIPVVVLTGMDDDELGKAAIRHGAEDFIAKSADPQTLRRSIHYAMARHRLKRDLRSVVEGNADAVVVVGPGDRVRYVNAAAERLFASSAPSWVGRPFGYPIPSRSAVLVDLEREVEMRTVEIRTTDIRWEEDDCLLLSIRDVTDRMRAQELERQLMHADRLAAIGQLAAGVAHEINNPATFVSSNLQCILERLGAVARGVELGPQIAKEITELVTGAQVGLDRIVGCARRLNVFSRNRGGEMSFGDVNDVVEEACTLTRSELRHYARLEVDLQPVPPVEMDRGAIAQVLVNLLINAAQAIQLTEAEREHEVRIGTRAEDAEVVIFVEDTGCGIPETIVRSVFDPFFTTKEEGTGLGLSICADVVQKHRGHIDVQSRPGVGTRFEIRLPARPSSLVVSQLTEPVPAATVAKRVLLIDDDHLVRRAILRTLRDHEVVDAAGVDEGLAALAKGPPFDVVLCDMMMPDRDGVAFYEEVAERFPEHESRIVFVSGGAFTRRVTAFLEKHDVPMVDKPVSAASMARVIARVSARDGEGG